jgi:hypothetical protein
MKLLKANEWFWRNGFFDFVSGKKSSVNFLEKLNCLLWQNHRRKSLANHPLMTHAIHRRQRKKQR